MTHTDVTQQGEQDPTSQKADGCITVNYSDRAFHSFCSCKCGGVGHQGHTCPPPWVHAALGSAAPPQPSQFGSHPCSQGTHNHVTSSPASSVTTQVMLCPQQLEQAGLVLAGSTLGMHPLSAGWQEKGGLAKQHGVFRGLKLITQTLI